MHASYQDFMVFFNGYGPLAHEIILSYTKDLDSIEIVGQCYLATEALAWLRREQVDLIFLDIQMPKLKGLDFLRTLSKQPLVIVTSAYEEYALESYELNVCDYLHKPFAFDRFLKAVNRAQERWQIQQGSGELPATSTAQNKDSNQLFIKVDKRHIQIDLTGIYYLESYGNYVKVWLADTSYLTARTLSSFEQQLPTVDFFRIHKSYILNRRFIDYVEGNHVVMRNGKELPIGKNQRTEFKRYLG